MKKQDCVDFQMHQHISLELIEHLEPPASPAPPPPEAMPETSPLVRAELSRWRAKVDALVLGRCNELLEGPSSTTWADSSTAPNSSSERQYSPRRSLSEPLIPMSSPPSPVWARSKPSSSTDSSEKSS